MATHSSRNVVIQSVRVLEKYMSTFMKHNYKHVVTSGCSFTAWTELSWTVHLMAALNIPVYNYGCPSAGNSWIAKTAIHATQKLLTAGVEPEDIIVLVMWSGIDRKDSFISPATPNYEALINTRQANPVEFLSRPLNGATGWESTKTGGYLLGSMACLFEQEAINKFKRSLIRDYYCDEALAIESYENFLRLQWYCQSKRIRLVNLTYMDIMHYPHYTMNTIGEVNSTYELFENIRHLHDMIDFDNWLFWNKTRGLYEYTRDNELPFQSDKFHPTPEAHEHFVKHFLIDKL